jgi:ATP-dependent Clp protease ATP-binding subunit ClpC
MSRPDHRNDDRIRERYHDEVRRAVQHANQLALRFNHEHLGSEHLLGALLQDASGTAARLLEEVGVELMRLKKGLSESLIPGTAMVTGSRVARTACFARALQHAQALAADLGHPEVDARHLLLGLAASEGPAAEVLRQAGVSVAALRSHLGGPGRVPLGDVGSAPGGNGAG